MRISTTLFGALFAVITNAVCAQNAAQGERGPGVPDFWVRPGYRVTVVSEPLEQPRFLEFDDKGNLYMSRPNKGDILTLRKKGEKYEVVGTFVEDMPTVHGMHWADGWLWFTQSGSVYRGRDTKGDGKSTTTETIIEEGKVPQRQAHFWRSILVGANEIFTGIGDSGNANDDDASPDPLTRERQKIWKFDKKGGSKSLWSSGIRNTEKLRFRPGTTEIWGVEHGTDKIGLAFGEKEGLTPISDVHPEEEFNHYVEGGFYGHPYVEGVRFIRPEFANRPDILQLAQKTILPEWTWPAHFSATGFTFLSKPYFGADHVGDAFVACKGSSSRSEKVGYAVERVMFDKLSGKPYGSWKIVGTLVDGKVLGRPVDCAEAPDGSIIFSDDPSKRLYRISKIK